MESIPNEWRMDLTWAAPLCWRRVTITVCTTVGKVGTPPQDSLVGLWISRWTARDRQADHGVANRSAWAGSSVGPVGIKSRMLAGTPVTGAPA
jgi:hypothetical protein